MLHLFTNTKILKKNAVNLKLKLQKASYIALSEIFKSNSELLQDLLLEQANSSNLPSKTFQPSI
jgi:hypothetical protein